MYISTNVKKSWGVEISINFLVFNFWPLPASILGAVQQLSIQLCTCNCTVLERIVHHDPDGDIVETHVQHYTFHDSVYWYYQALPAMSVTGLQLSAHNKSKFIADQFSWSGLTGTVTVPPVTVLHPAVSPPSSVGCAEAESGAANQRGQQPVCPV